MRGKEGVKVGVVGAERTRQDIERWVELRDDKTYASHTAAKQDIFQYIEGFYIQRRRHSALGYLSPTEFERRYSAGA